MITDAQKPCGLPARITSNLMGKPCELAASFKAHIEAQKPCKLAAASKLILRLRNLQTGHPHHFKADTALGLAAGATSKLKAYTEVQKPQKPCGLAARAASKLILRLRSSAGWQPVPLQSSY